MAEYDDREKETQFAVPEFWVYSGNPYSSVPFLRNKVDPEQAAKILAAYPDNKNLPHPTEPSLPLPIYVRLVRATWQHRESIEDAAEKSRLPLWHTTPWWSDNTEIHRDHYVRISRDDPAMLSYFQSPEKAARNVRTKIKPGRYLTRFFSEVLTKREIAKMARWHETGQLENDYSNPDKYPLDFAKTADEIVTVYQDGPSSCMSNGTDEFATDGTHPVAVYAAGDLAVAYLTEAATGKVRARALCWPAKTVFGRVYPTADGHWHSDGFLSQADAEAMQDALRLRLRDAGYTEGQRNGDIFDGAKLRKIELDDETECVMPYLDWGMGVDDCGDHFVIRKHGEYACDMTNGVLKIEDNRPYCENCEERCDADDLHNVYMSVSSTGHPRYASAWCEYCTDHLAFYCDGASEYFSNQVDHVIVGRRTYTEAYAETNFTRSDYSGEWFDGHAVEMEDGEMWSEDEFAKHGFECAVTGDRLPIEKRHPDYPEISSDLDDEQLAEYLATRETKETIE